MSYREYPWSYFSISWKKLRHLRKKGQLYQTKGPKRPFNNWKIMTMFSESQTTKAESEFLWPWLWNTKDLCVWLKRSYLKANPTTVWSPYKSNWTCFKLSLASITLSLKMVKTVELFRSWTKFTINSQEAKIIIQATIPKNLTFAIFRDLSIIFLRTFTDTVLKATKTPSQSIPPMY